MTARVTDVRHADHAQPGQQQQTVDSANVALEMIEGASCVVLISFAEKDGGWNVELGIAGSGPKGFSKTVADTLSAAAGPVGDAMARCEVPSREVGQS